MPITEADMSYEEMVQTAYDGHTCACGGILAVAWSSEYFGYILRCGNNINHDTMTRHNPKAELESDFVNKIIRGHKLETTALQKMDEGTMLTRIDRTRFPQEMTKDDKLLLAQVAITYGFDPLMGEVTIYQGRPYVSIDGRYRKAQETGELDGVESRPAKKEEREDWGIPEGDYFFRAEVYKKGSTRAYVGWGRVHKSETINGKGFKPVEKNPQRMAEKRAEAQALRKAFHIPLPSAEDIGSPEYDIESTAVELKLEPAKQASEVQEVPEKEPETAAEKTNGDKLTLGKILNWLQSHNKEYDRTWFFKKVSYTAEDLKTESNLEKALGEIVSLTGWDDFK